MNDLYSNTESDTQADCGQKSNVHLGKTKPFVCALTLLCWGIGLSSFSINFFNDELPLYTTWIGVVVLSLGLWILRSENKQLFISFCCSIVVLLMRTALYWMGSFPVGASHNLLMVVAIMNIPFIFQLAYMFYGLQLIARRIENEVLSKRLRRSFWLFLCFYLAALVGFFFPVLVYLAAPYLLFVFIHFVVVINQLKRHSSHVGYEMQPAVNRVKVLVFSLFIIVYGITSIVGNIGFLNYVNKPITMAMVYSNNSGDETASIRAQLAKLGMPDYVLNDLPEEEIQLFEGVYFADSMAEESYAIVERDGGKLEVYYFYGTLSRGKMRVLYYYRWLEPPKHAFVDTFAVWASPSQHIHVANKPEERGLSLYDKDGITYNQELLNSGELLDMANSTVQIQFRMHSGYENQRGYVAVSLVCQSPDYMISSNGWATYVHQESVWNRPYFNVINQWAPSFFWSKNGRPLDKAFWMEGFMTSFYYNPYSVTIIDGGVGKYGEGGYYPSHVGAGQESVVTVYAGTKTGYVFKEWIVEMGMIEGQDIFNRYSATTAFRMPPSWVVLRAVWEPVVLPWW